MRTAVSRLVLTLSAIGLAIGLAGCFGGPSGSEPPPDVGAGSVRTGDAAGRGFAGPIPTPVPPAGGTMLPPPPATFPPDEPPAASGDLMSCLSQNPWLDAACTDCVCARASCYLPVVECDEECLSLVACVLHFCADTSGSERSSCAIEHCVEYLAAAAPSSDFGPCVEPCREQCTGSLDAVIGVSTETDAGHSDADAGQ